MFFEVGSKFRVTPSGVSSSPILDAFSLYSMVQSYAFRRDASATTAYAFRRNSEPPDLSFPLSFALMSAGINN